ncbi:DUF6346 domain-containing protein [Salinispora fenicalii]|uniref:DUF6346 domain-containing protein n=1 Tax=Salinispora fenicalii TaxID=1137263 RepID=UPI001CC4999A
MDAEFARSRQEALAAYERRGPFWGRVARFAMAIALLVAIPVLYLISETLVSFYPGTGVVKSSPPERPAVATVQDCQRVGPVSSNGLGYWWHCDVTVQTQDGRQVVTTVYNSVVTPSDRGKAVEFREACFGEGNSRCEYGRPSAWAWAMAVQVFYIIRTSVYLFLIIGSGMYLVTGVVGVPRSVAWLERRERKKKRG